jgi:3D-(3,5/4)-trihydroxycyclohexane-1,2-dione acylhydrolase (decyclizing)
MRTIRLTMAQALVRYLTMQKILIEGLEEPLFPGVYAIFGHGNVTCLGEALEAVKEEMPTWRGQNEQSMALAGMAFTKSKRRRQIMVATSSIGPGSTNLLTETEQGMIAVLSKMSVVVHTFLSAMGRILA